MALQMWLRLSPPLGPLRENRQELPPEGASVTMNGIILQGAQGSPYFWSILRL